MTKQILTLLVAMLAALCATAQSAVGDWHIHTSFVGSNVTAVAESNRWVYYLSAGNLFRLDKDTQENEALSVINYLSDMAISQAYYNSSRDYLVIIYNNYNIDIILSDGTVVNMPEIKDAIMTTSKTVNDVTFAPGLIYLATGFGYVVIDDNKFVVKESHIFNTPLTTVAQVGNQLLLSTDNTFYYGDADEYHELLASFKTADFQQGCRIRPISDSTFFCLTDTTVVAKMLPVEVDEMEEEEEEGEKEEGLMEFNDTLIIKGRTYQLQATRDGWLLNVPNLKKSFKTDIQGMNPVVIDTIGELCSANPRGDGKYWAAGAKGLHLLGSDSYFLPNALTYNSPFWLAYNKSQDKLYVSSATANAFVAGTAPSYVNTFDGIRWQDVTPEGAPVAGSYWIEFMPDDPDTYFMSTYKEGVLKVYQNEIVLKYDTANSPIRYRGSVDWGTMHPITSIDRNGNLWVVQTRERSEYPAMMLPAAKTKQAQVTADDWMLVDIEGLNTGFTQRVSFISTKKGNYDIKVITDGDFESPIFFWNNTGGLSSRPPQVKLLSLTDQDGEHISWTYIMCLTEDLNGNVWMGSTEGICYFNPIKAFDPDFRAVRPKVPRNDGTGFADRLMDGIQVNDIAVDGANRKWIATQSSGLFLVSADGSQVLHRFNTTNSPLASNTVYRVCCNPNSNAVYITTPVGMYEYFSDSSPAESSYDNILAFPNPVRPEYGGDVTITGLMEGSLVKIADANGNVIRQLKSIGGMATWDLRDQSGNDVGSGVYLVLCSQSSSGGKAAVTKIAVIR